MPSLRHSCLSLSLAIALALPGVAHAAGVAPSQATSLQREQAQSRFVKGRELYTAGKHEAALAEFTASFDIVASPNTRLYLARCLRELGRTTLAYAELSRAAQDAKDLAATDPRYEKTAEAASEERGDVEAKLAFVEVTVTHAVDATTLKVAGDDVARAGWGTAIAVLPGQTELVVETPGRPSVRMQLNATAGERKSLTVDAGAEPTPVVVAPPARNAPPASSGLPPMRTAAYVAGGVAVLGLATFVGFGSMANGTYSDLETTCGGPCPPGHEDAISRGKTQQTIANVGLGVFAVSAAAAVTLFVVGSPKNGGTTTASVTAGPGFVGLRGGF